MDGTEGQNSTSSIPSSRVQRSMSSLASGMWARKRTGTGSSVEEQGASQATQDELSESTADYMVEEDDETDTRPLAESLRYFREQQKLLQSGDHATLEEESRFKVWIDPDELVLLLDEEAQEKLIRNWIRFDLFFGLLVCLNGAVMGLTTQKIVDEEAEWVKITEIVFLVFFTIEWGIRWYFNKKGFKGMLTDPWTCFDFIIITISLVDTLILGSFDLQSGASLVTALRVIRLMRLIRLVRLLRLLKELWMLVSGMMASVRILIWAIAMMAVVCYIFGLFMFELLRESEVQDDPDGQMKWGNVVRTMLTMAQIATYSGAGIMGELSDKYLGPGVMAILFVFIFIASLGILNLIVGVLLTSALQMASRDDTYASSTTRLMRHRALRMLRDSLIERCNETLGESTTHMVSRSLLLDWLVDERPASLRSSSAENAEEEEEGALDSMVDDIGGFFGVEEQKHGLAGLFQEAEISEDEIHVIFNEVDSISGAERRIALDEFIEACIWLKGAVHPLDGVNLLNGLQSLYHRLVYVEHGLMTSSCSVQATAEQIHVLLSKFHSNSVKEDEEMEGAGEEAHAAKKDHMAEQALILEQKEQVLLQQEKIREQETSRWDRFDLVFSMVVLANAAVLGVEVVTDPRKVRDFHNPDFDTTSMVWFIIEQSFFIIYTLEIGLRVIFLYQMRVQKDFRTTAYFIPKLLVVMDRKTQVAVVRSFPRWLKDTKTLLVLDVLIVVVAAMDNFVLRSINAGAAYAKVVRLLGLIRLLRLARLLHLIKPLMVLVNGFVTNVKLIFWSMVVLVGMIYGGAIVVVMLIGRDEATQNDEIIQKHWGHLGSAMLTLGQMVTYNSWGQRVEELAKYAPWIWPFMVIFMGMSSLGILNLVTGVMVQAAFNIVVDVNAKRLSRQVNDTKAALTDAIERAHVFAEETIVKLQKKMQNHIKGTREALRQQTVQAEKAQMDRLTVSRGRGSRRSAQAVQDGQEDENSEDDEMETKTGAKERVRSMYNEANSVTIMHAIWVGDREVVVGYQAREDSANGPLRDPMLSSLIWDGGRHTPVCYLPDDRRKGPGSGTRSFTMAMDGLPEEKAQRPGVINAASHLRGDLVFMGVPKGDHLYFRFGGNYSIVQIFPECLENGAPDPGFNMEDLRIVDREVVSKREMMLLLQDVALLRRLRMVNLRPDQVMMVYQSLNVTASGQIKVMDFIEGLLRMRRPGLGIDVAGAKSTMRRLLGEVTQLSKDAGNFDHCLMQVVQKLRAVTILEKFEAESAAKPEDGLGEMHQHHMATRNQILREKVAKLRQTVQERRQLQNCRGELGFGREPLEDDSSDGENASVASAGPGWD